jgi:Type IV pilin-like G and H, putative
MKNKILLIAILTGVFSAIAGGLSIAATNIREASIDGSKLLAQADGEKTRLIYSNLAKESEAKQTTALMNRAQAIFRVEHPEFTRNFGELGINLPSESQNYTYSIRSSDSNKFAQNVATAKTIGLKNYLGLIVYYRNQKGQSFVHGSLCVSIQANQKTTRSISVPKIKDGDPVCPKGYEKVTR